MHLKPVMPLASEGVLFASDIPLLAERVLSLGRRFTVVDGFSGSGKSTLAEALAHQLSARWIELDDCLSDDPDCMEVRSYVERVDRERLCRALGATHGAGVVIDGILALDVLGDLVPRSEMTLLYLARCSNPGESLIWHDGVRIEDGDGKDDGGWLERSELAYHRRLHPHRDADLIIIRVAAD